MDRGGTYRWRDNYRNPLRDWPMYPIAFRDTAWVEAYIRRNGAPIVPALLTQTARGDIVAPEPGAANGAHNWQCNYCAFYGSDVCPNPAREWLLLDAGVDSETAFQRALAEPCALPEPNVAPLSEADRLTVDNFFRAERGEALVQIEKPARRKKAAG